MVIRMPGVQKPHCSPWASRKADWSGCSALADGARPSTVVIVPPLGLYGEKQAGAHRLAVEQHGAGTAHAVLAAHMGAGETQLVAEEVAQEETRFRRSVVMSAVDGESDPHGCGHEDPGGRGGE